jgi:hypothetical protein
MVNDILMRDDDNWTIAGQIGILDLAKVSRLHLRQLNPAIIKKWTLLSQDSFPINFTGVRNILNLHKSFFYEIIILVSLH